MAVRKETEWQDLEVRINKVRIGKIRGIKYGVSTDKAHLFAEGSNPIGIQSGNKTKTGELTVLKGVLDDLHTAALATGGQDITDVQFDCVVTWKPSGNRGLQTVTLVQCEISAFEESMMQGDKEMLVTLPFLYMDMVKQQS